MRFMSYNKGLNLIVKTPTRMVYPNGLWEDVPGKNILFRGGMYETEDQEEIDFLKKHKLFNQSPGTIGAFWEYVPPRNLEAELAAKDAENEVLRKQIAEMEAAKEAAPAAPAKSKKSEPAETKQVKESKDDADAVPPLSAALKNA